MPATQVENGKSFEYALAIQYYAFLASQNLNVCLVENDALRNARNIWGKQSEGSRERFLAAAKQTIDTMVKIEPGLVAQKSEKDALSIMLQSDQRGEEGDVRDVVFQRIMPSWEIGFSAKNNHEAVKHSRLSHVLDFGQEWLGIRCSQTYWNDIEPIFDYIKEQIDLRKTWGDLGDDKFSRVYTPLLEAFKKELLFINQHNEGIPQKLIQYLIGRYPFYKIIKDDSHNLVVVKSFNINGELNKTVNGVKARYKTPKLALPTRIVEFDYKEKRGVKDTLDLILDGGWEISFRIHNASTNLEPSLKFDIQLLGNPPILFTQHLFQE